MKYNGTISLMIDRAIVAIEDKRTSPMARRFWRLVKMFCEVWI